MTLGDGIALVGLDEVGGAELLGHLELRLEHVDGDDLLAPAILAPWITLRPTPPQPMTATVSPGRMLAVLSAAPTPVSTPQPMSAAMSKGRLRRSSPRRSRGRWRVPNVPSTPSGAAARRRARGGSSRRACRRWPRHRALLAEVALPAVAEVAGAAVRGRRRARRGRRPRAVDALADLLDDRRRPRGRARSGGGSGMVPFWTDRSEWQTPDATILTLTSPAPGGAISSRRGRRRLVEPVADGSLRHDLVPLVTANALISGHETCSDSDLCTGPRQRPRSRSSRSAALTA